MFKIFLLSLFAICHCQSVVEVKDDGARAVHVGDLKSVGLQSILGNRFSTLTGGLQSVLFQPNVASVSVLRPPVVHGAHGVHGVHGVPSVSSVVAGEPVVSNVISGVPQVTTQYLAIPVSSLSSLNVGNVGVGNVGVGHVGVGHFGGHVGGNVVSAAHHGGPISAAIQNVGRTVEFRTVPFSDAPLVPTEIVVEPSEIPLNIHFKSKSSTVHISQSHQPGEPGTVETTQSQDEPSKVIHEVVKPVVQEVRELVQPYRQVFQEVHPVVEQVHTVVSRGEGVRQQYVAQPQVAYQPQGINVVRVAQPNVVSVPQPVSYQVVGQPQLFQSVVGQPQLIRGVGNVAQPFGSSFSVESHPALSAFHRIAAQQPNSFLSIGHPQVVSVQGQRPVQTVAFRQADNNVVRVQPAAVSIRAVGPDDHSTSGAEQSGVKSISQYSYNDDN